MHVAFFGVKCLVTKNIFLFNKNVCLGYHNARITNKINVKKKIIFHRNKAVTESISETWQIELR